MTILQLHDGETLADAFERVTRERDDLRQQVEAFDLMARQLTLAREQAERERDKWLEAQGAVVRRFAEAFAEAESSRLVAERENARLRALLAECVTTAEAWRDEWTDEERAFFESVRIAALRAEGA